MITCILVAVLGYFAGYGLRSWLCGERFTTYEITAARFEELLAAERDLRSMRGRLAAFVTDESERGREG